MDVTIFFARFYGSLFMILGLLSVLAGFLKRVIKYTDDKTITVSTGYITFLLGLVTVILHNIWVADWRVVVTVLGWTTLFKGIEKIALPGRVNKKAQMFKKYAAVWGFVIFLIGAWFFWKTI